MTQDTFKGIEDIRLSDGYWGEEPDDQPTGWQIIVCLMIANWKPVVTFIAGMTVVAGAVVIFGLK